MKDSRQKPSKDQSVRFVEAAKKTGADETGKKFERAFKKIVRSQKDKGADRQQK